MSFVLVGEMIDKRLLLEGQPGWIYRVLFFNKLKKRNINSKYLTYK